MSAYQLFLVLMLVFNIWNLGKILPCIYEDRHRRDSLWWSAVLFTPIVITWMIWAITQLNTKYYSSGS